MKTPRIVTDCSVCFTRWFGWGLSLTVAGLLLAEVRCFAGAQEAKQAEPQSQSALAKQVLAQKKVVETKKQKSSELTKEVITGTLIPRKVEMQGGIVNTPFRVIVIDSQEIQRTGATTVAGVLNRRIGR
jgi:hypothetical protein